jgi:hypothetical protein
MFEFRMKVVGVTFEGRQRVVAGLKIGQALKFVPDPSNPHDSHAVKVVTENGVEVGFVARDHNSRIFDNLMNNRGTYQVSVSSITGGGFDCNYGCNIKVVYTEPSPYKQSANVEPLHKQSVAEKQPCKQSVENAIEFESEDMAEAIEFALQGDYYQRGRIMEEFPVTISAKEKQTTVPVESFLLTPGDYSKLTQKGYSKEPLQIVVGAAMRTESGPVRGVEIRAMISMEPETRFNENFLCACWFACEKIYEMLPGLREVFGIRKVAGYAAAFYFLPEDYFLGLPKEHYRENLAFFSAEAEVGARAIEAIVEMSAH